MKTKEELNRIYFNKKATDLTADEIFSIIADMGNKSMSEYYAEKQREREFELKKKMNNLQIRQGTNEAWFIYDGNKVLLGSHDRSLIEKVYTIIKDF
jgi:hypothetical protein